MARRVTTNEVAKGLPEYYPIAEETGNYRLLDPTAKQLNIDAGTIEELQSAIRLSEDSSNHMIVERHETITVRASESIYRSTVEVSGTLIVEGTLTTTDLTVHPPGELIVHGEVVIDETTSERIIRLEKIAKLVGIQARDEETYEEFRARVRAEFAIMSCEGTTEDVLTATAALLDVPVEVVSINRRYAFGEVAVTFPTQALEEAAMTEAQLSSRLERLLAGSYSMHTFAEGTFTYITPETYQNGDQDPDLGYDGLDANGDRKGNGGTYAGVIS